MKTIFILFLLAATLYLQADDFTYSFSIPKGWEVMEEKELAPDIKYMARGAAKNLFASTINLALEPTDLNLNEYLIEVEKVHKDPSKVVLSLGDLQTSAGTMKIIQIDQQLPWADLRVLQGILIKDHVAYVVTATTEESQFGALASSLLESMKSFTIAPKRAKKR